MATHLPSISMPHTRRARARLAANLRSVAHGAERLLDATTDTAKETRNQLRAAVQHVKSTSGDWQDRGVDLAKSAATATDTTIRGNPYRSIGIAFCAGVLTGALLTRRSS